MQDHDARPPGPSMLERLDALAKLFKHGTKNHLPPIAPQDTGTAAVIGDGPAPANERHVHKLHTHDHSGDAGDGGTISHDDLDDVSADDHHDLVHTHADAGEGGTIDHGGLTGLGDDDHPQYAVDAHTHAHADTTGQTANQHHTENHASRHATGGADAVTGSLTGVAGTEYKPNADEAGVMNRLVYGQILNPGGATDDFDGSALDGAWTWAGAPFVTPTTALSTVSSVLGVTFATAANRAFLYRSGAPSVTGLVRAGVSAASAINVGLRLDDGSDDNYVEYLARKSGTYVQTQLRVRTGGGAVTTTANTSLAVPDWMILQLVTYGTAWSNWGHFGAWSTDGPQVILDQTGITSGLTWTPTRRGIIYDVPALTGATEAMYVDWVRL